MHQHEDQEKSKNPDDHQSEQFGGPVNREVHEIVVHVSLGEPGLLC